MMEADGLVKAYGVEGTPTLIVAGKYRVKNSSVRRVGELIELVLWFVGRSWGASAAVGTWPDHLPDRTYTGCNGSPRTP